ncbi:unnamed protein product [Euphydryas editha]|uniref:Uncharacterized protein n=1 Tax=Euphydryas editha TaxID=104508 RepID=A0AAU9TKZ6_EUPED|nr:unnamed protein product [Euphydryas editha]
MIIWRKNYLLRIKDFRREGRKIYYMDETWVNEGIYIYCTENPQKGKRLIVVHIGSEDSFLEGVDLIFEAKKTDREGDYHSEMDAHNFEKWFQYILTKVEPG